VKAVIFLGPTLAIEDARCILPEAIFLPPARQADLLSAVVNLEPDVIGLIDGVFLHTPSVWHKEILFALERGVHVFGSSSIGALRAAETSAYGMVGIGDIYERYMRGELTDDDEVALAHGPAEFGYRKMSEPLVNMRATIRAACESGVLDSGASALIIEAAKSMHFTRRSFPAALELARARGLPASVLPAAEAFVAAHYVDAKAQDAVLLLETLRDLPRPLPRFQYQHATGINAGLETMYNRDREVPVKGVMLPLADIAEYVALHDADFPMHNFNALNRACALVLARLLHVEATPETIELEASRFRRRIDMLDDDDFQDWMTRNNLVAADFAQLMKETALCRSLHRWLIYARFTERTTRLVLDHLRLEGEYETWAERAAQEHALLDRAGYSSMLGSQSAPLAELVQAHQEWTDMRLDTDPEQWAEEAGFNNTNDFKLALVRSALARRAVLSLIDEALATDEPSIEIQGAPSPWPD
jgi:hypothetical protein